MGKTQNTGNLTNAIAQDSSNNIGIGGAASGSYKFQVTGTTNLTGALSGTTATFSGNVGIGGASTSYQNYRYLTLIGGSTTQGGDLYLKTSDGSYNAELFVDNTGLTLSSNDKFTLLTGAGVQRLQIASTGAATFSSSVTAGARVSGITQNSIEQFNAGGLTAFSNGNALRYIQIGYDNTGNFGWIQALEQGTAYRNLILNGAGGNVGIGTSSPAALGGGYTTLDIRGSNGGGLFMGVSGNASFIYSDAGGFNLGTNNSLPSLFYTSGSERMRITSGGDLLIGTTTNVGQKVRIDWAGGTGKWGIKLDASDGGAANLIEFLTGGNARGSITTNGTTTSFNVTSDYRLKQDFKDYNGLDLVSAIKTYDYEWKSDKTRMYGLLAHELQEVLPYAVTGEKDAEQMQQVDYSKLTPINTKAIQELYYLVKEQQAQIEELKQKIN